MCSCVPIMAGQTIEALPMAMSMSTDVHYDHVNEHDVHTQGE